MGQRRQVSSCDSKINTTQKISKPAQNEAWATNASPWHRGKTWRQLSESKHSDFENFMGSTDEQNETRHINQCSCLPPSGKRHASILPHWYKTGIFLWWGALVPSDKHKWNITASSPNQEWPEAISDLSATGSEPKGEMPKPTGACQINNTKEIP